MMPSRIAISSSVNSAKAFLYEASTLSPGPASTFREALSTEAGGLFAFIDISLTPGRKTASTVGKTVDGGPPKVKEYPVA